MKNKLRRLPMKKLLRTTLLFVLAFCAGRLTAQVVEYNRGLQTANYPGGGGCIGRWELGLKLSG